MHGHVDVKKVVPIVSINILVTVSDMLLIFYIVYSGYTVGGEGGASETNRTLSKQCL
jgi:hypothetical protein